MKNRIIGAVILASAVGGMEWGYRTLDSGTAYFALCAAGMLVAIAGIFYIVIGDE